MKELLELLKFTKDIELQKLKKGSVNLIAEISWYVELLDKTMTEMEPHKRGIKIAEILNRINMSLDTFMHFTMNMDFEIINKLKKITEKRVAETKGN